jgi:hypothetical protein
MFSRDSYREVSKILVPLMHQMQTLALTASNKREHRTKAAIYGADLCANL